VVALSVLGLNWCQHAGWMVVLYDGRRKRRLQVTLQMEDAVIVGQELSGQCTMHSPLYQLVGAVVRRQPHAARIALARAGQNRASTTVVMDTDEGVQTFPTSTAVGVALAVRAGLPIVADEALMQACAVAEDEAEPQAGEHRPRPTPIPRAFHLALVDPPEDETP
jgi:bifunctional DNase/RNase